MKQINYTPEELNKIVYEVRQSEVAFQQAKDQYQIIHEQAKDILAQIKHEIRVSDYNVKHSVDDLESKARSTKEWKEFRKGWEAAVRNYGDKSSEYKHKLRILDAIVSGMAFKREMVKKGIMDI